MIASGVGRRAEGPPRGRDRRLGSAEKKNRAARMFLRGVCNSSACTPLHSRRLVRVLYNIRKPHCRHRTGSPPLIMFRAPQSPHRYSTPRIMGGTPDAEVAEGPAAPLPPMLVDAAFMMFRSLLRVFIRRMGDGRSCSGCRLRPAASRGERRGAKDYSRRLLSSG
jgi:hypothetical protein